MAGATSLRVPFTTSPPSIGVQNSSLTSQPYYAFFGTPETMQPLASYTDIAQTMRTFPEALKGQSRFLETTFTLLALTANAFLTTSILPLEYTNDLSFTWNEWVFHPYLPEQTPHLGVVRFVQSQTTTRRKALSRRGIGLTLEHGFMETELGRQTYAMEVRQIAQAINEGLQLEALFALMTAQKSELDRLRQLNGDANNVHNAHVDAILQRELDTWAYMQQTRHAWLSLDDYVERAIETYARGGFKAWIVDIRVESFRKRVAQDQTTFSIHGPGFMENMQQGAQHYSVDAVGNVVYATRSFLVDEAKPINPLESVAQIGEYFRCADVPDMDFSKYDTSFRTQLFYDEDADVMKPCTLKDKLANCGRFHPDGTLRTFSDMRVKNLNDLDDQRRDFLHYETPSRELVPLSLFGQLKPEFFNESDYQDLARTAFASLNTNSYEWRQYEKAFNTLIKYIQVIDRIGYDAKYEAWVIALTAWNKSEATMNTGANSYPGADGAGDIQGNISRSLDMFTDGNDYGFNSKWQVLPPTHGTYGGFKTIQSMFDTKNPSYAQVFNMDAAKEISEAITIFDDFVSKIAMYFPKSLAASALWVSPNIHNPEAHDAVFENLLCRQFPSRPIFVRPLFDITTNLSSAIADVYNSTAATLDANLEALKNAIAGDTATLRGNGVEDEFTTIQPSLRNLFNTVTGPLELLNPAARARANIGLRIGAGAADELNIQPVPGSKITVTADALSKAFDAAKLAELKMWMMFPTQSRNAAAAKAKILLWLAFVNTADLKLTNASDIVKRFERIIDTLRAEVGDINSLSLVDVDRRLVAVKSSIDAVILEAFASNRADYTDGMDKKIRGLLDQIDSVANLSAISAPANSNLRTRGAYNDMQNFRAAPIRIGRSAFITYVKTRPNESRFLPGSGTLVHAPMSNRELNDSESFPIWDLNYAESQDKADNVMNLPLVQNAKARLQSGAPQNSARRFTVQEFAASSRRISGMPSISSGPDAKRARFDSNIVGGSQSPDISTQFVEPPDFTTDNVDNVLPEHMKKTFKSLCSIFSGQIGHQLISFIFMFTPVTRQALEATVNYNLLHPFDYIVARPHATYGTVASIKMKPGSETGNTLFGNMQVTVGDDTTVQVVQAAVRFYQGAVIKKPDNIFVVRNSMVVSYHGGLGSGFINPQSNSYNPSIGLFGENRDASIIVLAIPRHERLIGRALSLSGSLSAVDPVGRVDRLSSSAGAYTYNTVAFYRRLCKWYSTQFNDYEYMVNSPGIGDIVPNTVVFSSTAIYRDPKTGQWNMGTSNLGHWKTHTVGANKHNARIGRESFNLEAPNKPFQIDFSF